MSPYLKQSRDYNIDLLKTVACIAVVGLHTFQKDLSVLNSVIYYLCGFAIPAFFMSSGSFLLNRKFVSWKYAFDKIGKILRVVIIWNLIIIALKLIVCFVFKMDSGFSLVTIPKETIKSMVQSGALWHFWYFGALIILYLILPLVALLNATQRKKILVAAGFIAVVFQVSSVVWGYPVQKNVIQTFRLWTWIFYFILGGILYSKHKEKKVLQCLNRKIVLALITVVVLIYQNLVGRFVITEMPGVLHAEFFYDSVLTMFWVAAIFIYINNLELHDKVKAVIAKLAPLTMGVYILHPLLVKIYQHFIRVDTVPGSIWFFVVILICSAAASGCINKIPLVKYLIRL